jgi:uncharacterized protein DUF4012
MKLSDDPGRIAASPQRRPATPTGRTRRRRTARRSGRPPFLAIRVLVIFLVGIAASVVIGDASLVHARQLEASLTVDLKAGADELLAGKQSVTDANAKSDPTRLALANQHFSKSRAHFESALHQAQSDLVVGAARLMPVLGPAYVSPRLNAVVAVAEMGVALDDAGAGAASIDAAMLKPASGDVHGGERLVQILKTAEPIVPKIVDDLHRAQQQAGLIDVSLLPASQQATISKAKAEIQKGLDGMNEFQQLAPALLDILGDSGLKTYLVMQVDPAELRAGGGFIGSYAILTINKGKINLEQGKNVADIDIPYPTPSAKDYVPQPEPLDEFTGVGRGWVFGDANFFPDFPTNAVTGEKLFLGETGKKVDGVISIDPWAVAALLEVTGPLDVPAWNAHVDAKTFPEAVFVSQEAAANSQNPNRKNFFPDVANLIIQKLTTLPADQWPKLLTALNSTVTQRHLQVYFNTPATEKQMDRMGWTGSLVKPAGQETMYEVEANLGGDKANHFLTRSYDLQLTAGAGVLHHKLVIDYKDATPSGFLGGRHYRCYLRFYYPADATGGSIVAAPTKPSAEKLDGVKLLDAWFQINIDPRRGFGVYSVTIQWDTPLPAGAVSRSIYWQKQPGTPNDAIKVTYKVGAKTFTAASDLSQDRVLVLTDAGVQVTNGSAGSAHLPTLG